MIIGKNTKLMFHGAPGAHGNQVDAHMQAAVLEICGCLNRTEKERTDLQALDCDCEDCTTRRADKIGVAVLVGAMTSLIREHDVEMQVKLLTMALCGIAAKVAPDAMAAKLVLMSALANIDQYTGQDGDVVPVPTGLGRQLLN